MSSSEPHITRITRTLTAMTSQIFRCHGLLRPNPKDDQFGLHDIAYWLIFISALAAWFLFAFAPQRERLQVLEDRAVLLKSHLAAEIKERKRMEKSIADLQHGDPLAWERTARERLGWVEPGEITDVVAWLPNRRIAVPVEVQRPNTPPAIPAVPPRPNVPNLPMAPANIRRFAQSHPPTDLLGPHVGTPPVPTSHVVARTPLPSQPAQRVSVTR